MHQEGLEPSAYRLEGGCSIRLSYWCKSGNIGQQPLSENTKTPCSKCRAVSESVVYMFWTTL